MLRPREPSLPSAFCLSRRVKLKASFKLTNANKIIFTIFTALKKNKQLVFQVITVLSGLVKRK
jgi:hypothetical protein